MTASTTDWWMVVVGGLISGTTVLVGVLLAEYLTRQRWMTSAAEEAASSPAPELKIDADVFTSPRSSTHNFVFGSDVWGVQQRVSRYLNDTDGRTGRKKNKFADARACVDETRDLLIAAEFHWYKGQTVDFDDHAWFVGVKRRARGDVRISFVQCAWRLQRHWV